jgi:hypothetical protein
MAMMIQKQQDALTQAIFLLVQGQSSKGHIPVAKYPSFFRFVWI